MTYKIKLKNKKILFYIYLLFAAFISGGKKTFKDTLSFTKKTEMNWVFSRIRQRYDHMLFRNYIKYEQGNMVFKYLDEHNPQYGGKVKVDLKEYNISQFQINNNQLVGYFNSEKIVLGKFSDENINVDLFNDEESLMEVTKEDISTTKLICRYSFNIDYNGLLYFKNEVNPNMLSLNNEEIDCSETELLPYGVFDLKEKLWHNLA